MQTNDKDKYIRLCEEEPSLPVFARDWWLDIVCGRKNWTVILNEDRGIVKAAMPIYHPLPGIISMPPYTQTTALWFAPDAHDAKSSSSLSRRRELTGFFADALSPFRTCLINLPYTITDWLPFYWNGFSQTTRYTYILHNIKQTDALLANMSANVRRNIARAQNKEGIVVRRDVTTEDCIRMVSLTFERQKLRPKHTDTLRRLIDESRRRGQADVWGGYDADGRLHAAVFVVWQTNSAYYIAGGADPALRSSGAHSLVMWEAIRTVSAFTDTFDFEGSMLEGVERFFREFGAMQTPYFAITKGRLSVIDRLGIRLGRLD